MRVTLCLGRVISDGRQVFFAPERPILTKTETEMDQNFEETLSYLESKFEGQVFLFDPDLAKILGKTERQLVQMRYRGTFPFFVHYIGRNPAVSIREVAEMLAKKKEQGDEIGGEEAQIQSQALGDKSRKTKEEKAAAEGSDQRVGRPSLGPLLAGFANGD